MDKIHVHKTKKSICAHFAESPCIFLRKNFFSRNTIFLLILYLGYLFHLCDKGVFLKKFCMAIDTFP